MNNLFIDIDLLQLRKFLNLKLGLNFLENQEKELVRKMEFAAEKFGFPNLSTFTQWLYEKELSNDQIGELACHLTIGETYFMREKKGFDFLEQIYLPGLINKRFGTDKRVRIWCAGCATGEEAYSLAITLSNSIPDLKQWKISIIASDINRNFLEKAKKAVYTKWSFRNNTPDFIHRYFTCPEPGKFQVKPEIRQMVTFIPFNLANDSYAELNANMPAFDIIFCRNVLIYFSIKGALKVTNQIFDVLATGGILVVSPVEVSGMISPKFDTINYAGFTIYHKGIANKEFKTPSITAFEKPKYNGTETKKQITIQPQVFSQKPIQLPIQKTIDQKITPPIQASDKTKIILPNFEKAKELYDQGKFDETEEILNQCIDETGQSDEKSLLLLAKVKANLGKLEEAELLCKKTIEMNKLNPNIYYLLATIMQEQGDDENAMSFLKSALYLNPDFVLAHFLYGTLCLKSGNTLAGNKSFKNALSGLAKFSSDDILPESDGITAGRFKEIIQSITI